MFKNLFSEFSIFSFLLILKQFLFIEKKTDFKMFTFPIQNTSTIHTYRFHLSGRQSLA